MTTEIIDEWPRNAREIIRISLAKFEGAPVVDLRVWFKDGGGRFRPAKQGLTLSTRQLPRLTHAMKRALASAEAGVILLEDAPHSSHD